MGPNGSGKTSILEAVHLLGTTLSFRTRRDGDLIRRGAARARVLGDRIEILIGPARTHLRDGEVVRRGDLLGLLPVTPLLPGDIGILLGPASERRRFLDLAIAQRMRGYGGLLLRLRRIERQRRSALASGGATRPWALALAEAASAVIRARGDCVALLAPHIAASSKRLLGRALEVRWVGPAAIQDPEPGRILEILEGVSEEEARTRRPAWTSNGWDLDFSLDNLPISRFGSQGELRAASIALRLGVQRFLGAERGLLLVDDVWGELDASRREALLEEINETPSQVLFAMVEIGALQSRIQGISCFPLI